MTRAKNRQSGTNNSLIDWVRPEETDGPLIGAVLSTYGLSLDQPDFFGQDFLPTMLGMGGVRDRGYASPVTLDRSLAMTDVVLICDAHALVAGVRPTLRVDLLPIGSATFAKGPEHRIHHAKIHLIHRQNLIRLIVASANLTHEGFRKQREAAVVLDFYEESTLPTSILTTAIERWTTALGDHCDDRIRRIFDGAGKRASKWSAASARQSHTEIEFVFGGGPIPLWRQFVDAWPRGESVLNWNICSPFWPQPGLTGGQNPFEVIAAGLVNKQCALADCELEIVACADSPNEKALPRFPFELVRHLRASKTFPILKGRILPAQLAATEGETPQGMAADNRDLHAKWIVISGPETVLALIGSANFTRLGLGVLKEPTASNLEACVLIRWPRGKWRPDAWRPPIQGRSIDWSECGEADLRQSPPEEEPRADWPVFIRDVELEIHWEKLPEPDGDLVVHLLPGQDAPLFEVSCPNSPLGDEMEAPPEQNQKRPIDAVRIQAGPHQVRTLLARRIVQISWDRDHHALFPINVSQESKTGMPSILGAKPSEEQLLAYFHGRISEDDLLERLVEQARNQTGQQASSVVENERRRQMQNYIVREFVESLFGLVDTIRDSARSPRAAEQALMGDLSPIKLGGEVIEAFMAGRRSPAAAAFQMVELIGAVGSIQWLEEQVKTASDRAVYEQLRRRALDQLFKTFSQAVVRENFLDVLQDGDFQIYVKSTLASPLFGRWESFVKACDAKDKT
jgi:hypothetical protein